MYFKVSWEEDFDTLMMHLWSKYGKELFTLDGIGEQMDINKFSQDFFNQSTTTADVSVDGNANVSQRTSIEYNFELPKPLRRYNSYFLLWKQLRKEFGLEFANRIIEAQLNGDIYINDFTDVALPYSYHPGTTIIVKDGISVHCIPMNELFAKYSVGVKILPDMEEIDLRPYNLQVLDKGEWVRLERVVRHISHADLLRVETKRGSTFTVTEDHPCILEDGKEVQAVELKIGDRIAEYTFSEVNDRLSAYMDANQISNAVEVSSDKAYCIGAMVGDGSVSHNCVFHQKDVQNSVFYPVFEKVYGVSNVDDEGRSVVIGTREDTKWFLANIGSNSRERHFPTEFLMWADEAKEALLAGIIDTDGCVNRHTGVVDVRVISVALVQQVAALVTSLGCKRVRTSLVKNYQRGDETIRSNSPMYRVSFVIPEEGFERLINKSYKLSDNKEALCRSRGMDGRFESNEILKIEKTEYIGKYVYDITTSSGKFYSNGSIVHNCFNYSVYDIAVDGLNGLSNRPLVTKPKSLDTFIRQVEQFMVVAANSTLGATGIATFLLVASHYVRQIMETGYDGHVKIVDVEPVLDMKRVRIYLKEKLTEFIYTVNWTFRGNQSPFSNLSVYDEGFLYSLCPEYVLFGRPADPEIVKFVQEVYLDAMNEELARTPLTFPVTTACFCTDEEGNIEDKEFMKFIAEKNLKYGFINIYCGKSSTLSSCCRLRSESDNPYFNSFGAGSEKIGSLGVVTANLPRAAMRAVAESEAQLDPEAKEEIFFGFVRELFDVECMINKAKRSIIEKRIELGAAPLYTHGYMALNKQYSTFGVVGLNEAVSIMGYDILTNEGQEFVTRLLENVNDWILHAENQYKAPHNCEMVPAESSAIKLVQKDKMLGYDCGVPFYSNQFIPLIVKANMLDRIRLQGKFDRLFSGGAICHVNVSEEITDAQQIVDLIEYAAKQGVVYWAINYRICFCKNHHSWVATSKCPVCGGEVAEEYTRVVGFLTNTKNWNKTRREHDWPNRQFYSSLK